jgi:hypothetical protein
VNKFIVGVNSVADAATSKFISLEIMFPPLYDI